MNKINVTDARKDMSTFFDGVIHEKPIILKKRKYEAVLIEKSLLKEFLENDKLEVKTASEDNNKVVLTIPLLNLVAEGSSRVEAIENLCENAFAYANDVYDNFMFYYYGQNIKDKLGYIFNILLCEDNNELKELFEFAIPKKSKKK